MIDCYVRAQKVTHLLMFKLITGVLQDFFREIIKNEIEYYYLSFFSVFFLKKDQRGPII